MAAGLILRAGIFLAVLLAHAELIARAVVLGPFLVGVGHAPRVRAFEDFFKDTPIIIEEIDDLEVIVELKNDLQVALKAIKIQEEALTSAYQPQTLEEAEHLELELKKALKVVEEMKGKLPGKK